MLISTWKHAYAAQATCYCCSVQYTILCTHQQFSLSAKCIILKLTNITALFCIAHLSLALWSCVSCESLFMFFSWFLCRTHRPVSLLCLGNGLTPTAQMGSSSSLRRCALSLFRFHKYSSLDYFECI